MLLLWSFQVKNVGTLSGQVRNPLMLTIEPRVVTNFEHVVQALLTHVFLVSALILHA